MSWDVILENAGEVPKHEEGGTYALGGCVDPELNITYNYSKFYYQCLDQRHGLRWLHGKRAGDTIARLEGVIEILGTVKSYDYWKATSGNAGHALSILLSWARMYPDAEWIVN